MKVIFLQRSKHIVRPEIKYFPAIYVDGQVVCFADLRITFPRRTVHIIFNNAGRKEKDCVTAITAIISPLRMPPRKY